MFAKGPGGTFTAVDFDARRIRVVRVEVGGRRPRVRAMHTASMPADINLADAQAVGKVIGAVLREQKLGGAPVLMSVPRGQAVLKPLTLPRIESHDELPGMVRYQVEKELPFHGEQAVIDFALENHFDADRSEPTSDGGLELLVAAVHLKVVDHYQAIAEAAGVKLRRLGLRPYANMCCIEACHVVEPGHKVAVVHITADETQIDVFAEQSVAFSRAAAVRIGVPREDADDAAATNGEGAADPVEQVVTEVTRSLKSYHAVHRSQGIRRILVAGDTGIEQKVIARLAEAFDVPCVMFAPGSAIEVNSGVPEAEVSAYVTAFGLAIGQGGRSVVPFDFLNPKKPVRRVDPRKRKLIVSGVAAAIVLLVSVGWTAAVMVDRRAETNRLINQANQLEEQVRRGSALVGRVGRIEQWHAGSRQWLAHWTKLSALFPSASEAYITALRSSADNHINLTLRARSGEAITALGERLTEAGYEFTLGRITTASDPYGYGYNATIAVIVDPRSEIDLDSVGPIERPSDDASHQVLAASSRQAERQPAPERGSAQQPAPTQRPEPTQPPQAAPRPQRQPPAATPPSDRNPRENLPQRRGGGRQGGRP